MSGSYAGIYTKILDFVLEKGDRVGLSVLMGLAARADKYGGTDIGVERLSRNIKLDALSVYNKLAQFERMGWIQIRPITVAGMSNARFLIRLCPDVLMIRSELIEKVRMWWDDPYEFHFMENRNIQSEIVSKQDQPAGLTNGYTRNKPTDEPATKPEVKPAANPTPLGQRLAISAVSDKVILDFASNAEAYEANNPVGVNLVEPAPASNNVVDPNIFLETSSPITENVVNSADLADRIKQAVPSLKLERIRQIIANEGVTAAENALRALQAKDDVRDPARYFVATVKRTAGARPKTIQFVRQSTSAYEEIPF